MTEKELIEKLKKGILIDLDNWIKRIDTNITRKEEIELWKGDKKATCDSCKRFGNCEEKPTFKYNGQPFHWPCSLWAHRNASPFLCEELTKEIRNLIDSYGKYPANTIIKNLTPSNLEKELSRRLYEVEFGDW